MCSGKLKTDLARREKRIPTKLTAFILLNCFNRYDLSLQKEYKHTLFIALERNAHYFFCRSFFCCPHSRFFYLTFYCTLIVYWVKMHSHYWIDADTIDVDTIYTTLHHHDPFFVCCSCRCCLAIHIQIDNSVKKSSS